MQTIKGWTTQEKTQAKLQANRLLTGCNYNKEIYRKNGNTQDIIDAIIEVEKTANNGGQKIAHLFKKYSWEQLAFVLFDFVKTNIFYSEDRTAQNIKNADCLWAMKIGDCKSFSLFIGSVLKALGVPYGYRFVSFNPHSKTPTHVYIIYGNKANPYIIDAVYSKPLSEKPYKYKIDYWMSEINKITGIGNLPILHHAYVGSTNDDDAPLLEHELDVMIDQLLTEGEKIVDAIELQEEAINGHYINGRRKNKRKKNRAKRKARRQRRRKRIKNVLKKAGKGIVKAVTFSPRKIIQGMLRPFIKRGGARYFLYVFIKPETLAKLPAKVQEKAAKQRKFYNFITQKLGMKQAKFKKLLRGGIMKKHGKTPEQIVAQQVKKSQGMAYVGIEPVTTAAIISAVVALIKLIASKAGGGAPSEAELEDSFPMEEDFGNYSFDAETGEYLNADGSRLASLDFEGLMDGDEYTDDEEEEDEGGNGLLGGSNQTMLLAGGAGLLGLFLLMND